MRINDRIEEAHSYPLGIGFVDRGDKSTAFTLLVVLVQKLPAARRSSASIMDTSFHSTSTAISINSFNLPKLTSKSIAQLLTLRVDAVRPRGSSRSCTHSGKSRISNVAAANRFGGKSVATTLSLQAAFVVIVTVAVAVEVFSLGDREAVQILMCKFTVSRLPPPPHAVVRTTSLDPEVSRDFDHRLRSDSNCYQSRCYARSLETRDSSLSLTSEEEYCTAA
ncbi:hypothetical protein ALC53_13925 [Atta colombica]|uniref:Uncharacterized protein n=1 Tax=Atta colombica TaxID=520822 RepID=A0A195AV07_9HYME|nr:hypothetical protein ALC53_13925 [Atta colombica]